MTANFVLSYQGDLLAGVDEVGRGPLAGDVGDSRCYSRSR